MNLLTTILLIVGIYTILSLLWLAPFMLSARISRTEE